MALKFREFWKDRVEFSAVEACGWDLKHHKVRRARGSGQHSMVIICFLWFLSLSLCRQGLKPEIDKPVHNRNGIVRLYSYLYMYFYYCFYWDLCGYTTQRVSVLATLREFWALLAAISGGLGRWTKASRPEQVWSTLFNIWIVSITKIMYKYEYFILLGWRNTNRICPTPPLGQDMTQGHFLSGV